MRKIKVFKIGSCRTSIANYLDNDLFECEYNFDLTHTTKEVLMYLDIINGDIDLNKIDHPSCLMRHQNKFKRVLYKKMIESSDILLIEISSIKIVKKNEFYYQIVRYNEENSIKSLNDFKIFLQSEEDFKSDIEKIYLKVGKPIIFVPHITMDFDKETKTKTGENIQLGNETLKSTREKIESYVVNHTKYNIKTSELFKNYHYEDICDCSKKFDPNHYTDLGYKLLAKKFEDVCKEIHENI